MNDLQLSALKSWCSLNDPVHVTNLKEFCNKQQGTIKYTLDTDKVSVVSSAIAIGNSADEEEDIAKKMSALLGSNTPTSLPEADYKKLLVAFKNAPASGGTTLLDMARVAAGFNPIDVKNNDATKYNDYIKRVFECPLFTIEMNNTITYDRKDSDWQTAIEDIANLYEGIDAKDKEKIESSLKQVATAASSNEQTCQSESLFAQSSLNINSTNSGTNEVIVYIYSSNVQMEQSSSKGGTCRQTKFTISKSQIRFYSEFWEEYAETVMNRHIKVLNDWLDNNNTKDGSRKINFTCLKTIK
jgi:hypothetical protein